jgi:hypothetical protein
MKAVSEAKLFARVGYIPHDKQAEVYASRVRNKVVAAGRRGGKSDIGGHRLVTECFITYYKQAELKAAGKRREFWIVGPEYSDSEKEFRVLWNTLQTLEVPFDRPGSYNDPHGGNMHLSIWGGRFQAHAMSARHPETLVGEGLNGVILAEAAKLKAHIWPKFLRPMLADYAGWSLMTSTPEGKNWFYDAYMRGQDELNAEWASWRMPSWMNPYVYKTPTSLSQVLKMQRLIRDGPRGQDEKQFAASLKQLLIDEEVASLIRDLTEPTFNQEIAALFTEFAGRVFARFDEETHVATLPFNPKWKTYGAVDYGFTNPNVWLLVQIGPFGQMHVVDEVYQAGLTAREFADLIVERGACPPGTICFYPDPASPADSRVLEQVLKVRARGGTGGEKKYRIDAIRGALKIPLAHLPDDHPERIPTLRISRRCVNTIRDFNDYRYPEKRAQQKDLNAVEEPMKKNDHAPEALGRLFAGMNLTKARKSRTGSSTLAGS